MNTELARFNAKWQPTPTGCWEWTAARSTNGYGRFLYEGTVIEAHSASYRMHVGEVPTGKQLDHLCRNKLCVKPQHLEPVTARQNTLRGDGPSARNAAATHCRHGHEFTPENTYLRRGRRGATWRDCRTCKRRRHIEWLERTSA